MSTKDIERCLKTSIRFQKVIWFSNHDLGTTTSLKGEGIDEVIGLSIGDFDDSPLLDFVEERVNFLLGSMERVFESLKKCLIALFIKSENFWMEWERDGSQIIWRRWGAMHLYFNKCWLDNLGKRYNWCEWSLKVWG